MNTNNIEQYKNAYNEIYDILANDMPKYADHLHAKCFTTNFCPEIQFITVEALNAKDIPNNISENGIFLCFEINFNECSVEIFTCGHVWLSDEEKKATYLAMASMKNICKGRGVSWMRKSKFKDLNDLHKKMKTFFDKVMTAVDDYTQGYPYKQGIGWVDKSKNQKIA